MTTKSERGRCPTTLALRWVGRSLGLAAFAFVAWFLIAHVVAGEGPNPLKMTAIELALFTAFFAAVAGMVVGWRWEVIGGVLVVGGMLLFFLIDWLADGSWPRGWVLWSLPLPGVLYLVAACLEACAARQRKVAT
jgi:hypothetical protein